MFGLCTKKACILVGIITLLLPLLYDIRVDAAPGPHGIMHQYRARIGSNNTNNTKQRIFYVLFLRISIHTTTIIAMMTGIPSPMARPTAIPTLLPK